MECPFHMYHVAKGKKKEGASYVVHALILPEKGHVNGQGIFDVHLFDSMPIFSL